MDWKNELKNNVSSIKQLKKEVGLSPKEEKQLKHITDIHPMRITRYYLSLIDKNKPDDPVRKMIIPSTNELNLAGSYDTSGEKNNTKMPGLQHMYPQTALILATNRCPAYCRYCFRKRLIGLANDEILQRLQAAARYIKENIQINNVLISGGDPFILPTKIIAGLLKKLTSIKHLDFIRLGTRTPVTFPARILEDRELLSLFKNQSKKEKRIYITTQFNHPREITKKSINAIACLIRSNLTINNQTVLLKGVNDCPQTLAGLQKQLVSIGVNPYYVFQCRPVKRIKNNFQVPLQKGYQIVEEAKEKLDGLSKRFRYVMSHQTGKIEIISLSGSRIYFKYHQAKNSKNLGKFFHKKINQKAGWLDELH